MSLGKLEIVRGASALWLNDLRNYALTDHDGFGAPPMHLITERGPLQHGESYRGYRLDTRQIQIGLTLHAQSMDEMYARRSTLLDYLSPVGDTPLIVRLTQPNGAVRQAECYCTEGPAYGMRDALDHRSQRCVIRLTALDPAWYDPARQSVRVIGGGGGSGFMVPVVVPWTLGGNVVDSAVDLDYPGTWIEYPEIVISGPITDARIEHLQTGDVLDFDGVTIDAGDSYTIDLRYGHKTVVDAAGANKIADLTPASDLAVWRLQPGMNNIRFSGGSAGETTSILLRYYNRYLGV